MSDTYVRTADGLMAAVQNGPHHAIGVVRAVAPHAPIEQVNALIEYVADMIARAALWQDDPTYARDVLTDPGDWFGSPDDEADRALRDAYDAVDAFLAAIQNAEHRGETA